MSSGQSHRPTLAVLCKGALPLRRAFLGWAGNMVAGLPRMMKVEHAFIGCFHNDNKIPTEMLGFFFM
jgi:hypothetical protein